MSNEYVGTTAATTTAETRNQEDGDEYEEQFVIEELEKIKKDLK